MNKNLRNRVLIITGVLLAALYFAFPIQKRINLGLDLKGGMHLVIQVETEKMEKDAKVDAVERAIEILRNRIDAMGVGETIIQRQGEKQILIQLPGVTDRETALRMIGQVAQLDFYLVEDNPSQLQAAVGGNVPEGHLLKYTKNDQSPILLKTPVALKGELISDARVDVNTTTGFGEPRISLKFNAEGAKIFADVTRSHVHERLAIVLDDQVLSAPNINEPILSGRGEISGQFTFDEASLLALSLRSGSLPAPMHVEEERTIGPLLGSDSIKAGINAAMAGGLAVFLFMMVYYLTAGVISDIALAFNLLLIFGIMGLLNVLMPESQMTLTLPGIAGIILTLGMAVDSNVIINERIREELHNGRPLSAAVANGFNKAFSAIFDSNFTTLIAAFMLFQFGSGPIKGFAVTLAIGLITSMFTAIFVTQTLFLLLLEFNWIKSLPMLQFFPNTKIDFISKRYFCYFLSIILVGWGMFAFFQKGTAAYGIDFAGGQIQEYQFSRPVDSTTIREYLKEENIHDVIIQTIKEHPENIIIRTPSDTFKTVENLFKTKMPDNHFEILRIENVGPIVGKALREAALLAMVCALIGIMIYVTFRFKHFEFGAAGVIALLHDVVVALGCIILLGRQVDLLVITALLTIAGYSINDTIVIYDRVRENMSKERRLSLREIVNLSVNQTLGRTILTTAATMLVVVALYFLGGEVLNTFALTLLIGFISGTYSTIYIASPLVLAWEKKK